MDGKSLTLWLKPSFWALPSEQHRQVFFETVTLTHGEPQTHLCATWAAHVRLDRGLSDNAAGLLVSRMLEELLDSSLITIILTTRHQQDSRRAPCRLPALQWL